jgi:hypothetical protein
MRRLIGLLALAVLIAVPASALGQETYTIKIKKATKGSQSHEERVQSETSVVKVLDLNGKELQVEKKGSTVSTVFEQTVLERPDPKKKATSLKRAYEKANVKSGSIVKDLPYQGKTVLIEKKGDTYTFKIEGGGAITGEDAKWLNKEFNESSKDEPDVDIDELILPTKPVKVGESWKIPTAEFVKFFEKTSGMTTFGDKATGTGTLTKAYKKDGRQFGDMQIKLEIPLKTFKQMDKEVPFEKGAAMVIDAKVSGCIDGSLEDSAGTMGFSITGTAVLPPDNPMFRLDLSIQNTEQGSSKESLKK